MKLLRLIPMLALALFVTSGGSSQDLRDAPVRGGMQDIFNMRRVYILTDDEDSYTMISRTLRGYKALEIVNSPKDAQFILEYKILTRDDAPGYRGADMAKRSQLRAVVYKDDTRLIAWSETETFDMDNGMSFNRPNEVNLARNFIKAHKGAFLSDVPEQKTKPRKESSSEKTTASGEEKQDKPAKTRKNDDWHKMPDDN